MKEGPRIGVDLGGTKIEAIVLMPDGEIARRHRVDTPDNYEATLDAITELVLRVETESGVGHQNPVGMGTPGAISALTGNMKNCNNTALNGRALKEDMESKLERAIRIANDADCLTLSEANDGAASEASSVFGVILGTGVGGGLCYHGELLKGANSICGEWGHTTLPLAGYQPDPGGLALSTPSRECYCERRDCVETWLAGPSFARSYQELARQTRTPPEIVELTKSDDEMAEALLEQYCNLLALALSAVINIVDPDVIVLGGGMSNIKRIYDRVPEYLPRYVFSDHVTTRLVKAQHGDSSGVRGAAWLWPNDS
jgi:predicted NBD/HSP70 family sugar kinase